MREIVFDTETTGFDPDAGDRVVEIGCLELQNHLPTGNTFHVYINPERAMPQSAFEVHGLGDEFLADKPKFSEIADEFLAFIGDAKMVAHNASFDFKFVNAELKWAGKDIISEHRKVDTLELARKKFPGAQNSLDALCRRFGVDNSGRQLHGALLDSELLAEVYLELLGGRQRGLDFAVKTAEETAATQARITAKSRPEPLPPRISADELQAHQKFLEQIKEPLWEKFK